MFTAPSLPSPKSLGVAHPQLLRARSFPRVSAAYAAAPPRELAASSTSLYDVLGLSVGATGQEVKAAYRRLARACHPDVVTPERKGASADEFMRIHAAYATLSDPDKRADYDRQLVTLRSGGRALAFSRSNSYSASSRSPASFSRSSRRSWETDQCW